ncbi:MAG: hypothetical protein M3Y27_14585 [Acidobacteriota bacterium]|nr:hypothetical protein [Acidobacteriota bacterium]
MRKIKEVLRLRFGLGLHQDQIARSCSIGQATVHRYLEKAAAAKLVWPLPDNLDRRPATRSTSVSYPTVAHAIRSRGLVWISANCMLSFSPTNT